MLLTLTLIFLFVLGLAVGSFANVVILRLRKGEEFVLKGSYCPKCKKPLKLFDLIPVLSFLFLGGKCRQCKKKISLQYPFVELAMAGMFVLMGWFAIERADALTFLNFEAVDPTIGVVAITLFMLYLTFVLVVLFVYDLKYMELPDVILVPAIIATAIFLFVFALAAWESFLIGAAIGFLFFLMIYVFSRGKGIGGGDVKLGILVGLLCCWPGVLIALLIAFVVGAIVGISLVLARKKTMKSSVPFGVFMIPATIFVILWGQKIVEFFLN